MEAQVPWLDVEGGGRRPKHFVCNSDHLAIINTYANASPKLSFYEVPQELYQGPEFRHFGCIVETGKCIGFCGVLVGHYSRGAHSIPVEGESRTIEVSRHGVQLHW